MTNENSATGNQSEVQVNVNQLKTSAELKEFLLNVREKLEEKNAAPVTALSAMNFVLTRPWIQEILDAENKELARQLWSQLKQAGFKVKNPPILFGEQVED